MSWRIDRYQRPNGDVPFDEFIEGLQPKVQARVLWTVELLETFGAELREPYCKKMTGTDLWELRVKTGSNAYRIFYVAWTGKSFILFNGFAKTTEKTPKRQLEKALGYLDELRRRTT
jgi:phage-related protein